MRWLHGASHLLLVKNPRTQGLPSGAWKSWHFREHQGRDLSRLRSFSKPKIWKMYYSGVSGNILFFFFLIVSLNQNAENSISTRFVTQHETT